MHRGARAPPARSQPLLQSRRSALPGFFMNVFTGLDHPWTFSFHNIRYGLRRGLRLASSVLEAHALTVTSQSTVTNVAMRYPDAA